MFSPRPGPDGVRKLVSMHRDAMPTAALPPGEYLVNAAYGLSNLTRKIKVESGRSLEETFVLNTGGLKLAAVLVSGMRLSQSSVRFDILSDDEDQFGNRRKIMEDAKPGLVIRLNAGAYHIVSLYGDANATVRADVTVEPGKITEATIKHAAAAVTFKLVQSPGGEALADTQWSILTTTGDVVKENAGALPTHILAVGDYAVVAKHNAESYTSKFEVVSGQAEADRGGDGVGPGLAGGSEGDHRTSAASPTVTRGGDARHAWRARIARGRHGLRRHERRLYAARAWDFAKSGGTASAAIALIASSRLSTCWACDPSRLTETVPSSASRLPTTNITGTLASECSRTL